ncbi:MAG: PAS domain S-box protein [Planctomycetota bacterium]|nr:PAS domain S-box protein [Planctomycetota bacterium]
MGANHLKLLAIDDNQDNLTTLKAVVREALPDCTLLAALNGTRGIELARSEDPDVILLDIVMPGMDGFDVCRRLKADDVLRSIPVVFLTALRTDRESRVQALEAGAEAFLSKPLDEQELVAQVRAMAKLKAANRLRRLEQKELVALVAKRTQELEQELTSRKRAEGALHESHVRFELVAEGTVGAIWDWDVPNKQVYFSPRWKELRGYRHQEITSNETEWIAGIHPDDAPRVMAAVQSHFSGETDIFAEEYRVRRKDGSWFWVADRGKALFDETGRVIRMAGSEVDITLRKQYEALQAFLAHTSGGTAEEPFFQMLARHLAQSLGMDFVCIDRLEGDGCTARTEAVWCDGHFEDNVTYALKDTPCGAVVGQAVCCFPAGVCQHFPRDQVLQDLRAESYVGVTLFDHAGRPIGLIAVISRQPLVNRPQAEAMLQMVGLRAAAELERLDAETALRASEERYRSIIAVSNTGAWEYHLDTDSLWCSPEYFAMLGRDPAPFVTKGRTNLQKAWVDLLHPDDQERASRVFANYLAGGSVGMYENSFRLRHRDGHWVWIWSRGQTLRASDGTPTNLTVGTHIDITVSKQAEESLRESEERFRGFIENATDIVYALTPDGRFTYVSPNWREFMEEAPAAAVGTSFERCVHPDDVPLCREFLQRVGNATKPLGGLDYRVVRPDGSIRWHCSKGSACRDEEGHLIGYLGIARDITERKQIEETQAFLAQTSGPTNEAFFNSLARYLAQSLGLDFVCIDRLEGDGLTARTVANWCDGQFADNITYALPDTPCGQAVGKRVCCFPANVRQLFPRDLVLQDLRAESYAGVTLWSHVGRPIGLIAVIGRSPLANRSLVETTLQLVAVRAAGELERQQAEESLRASDHEFRSLAEAMPQIVWITRADGWNIYFNQQWVDYTGLTLEESYGHGWNKPFHPDDQQRAWQAWQNATQNDDTYSLECRLRRADGVYHWWLIRGVPLRNASGEILKWFGTCTDIEDIKRTEEVLRKSESQLRAILDATPFPIALVDVQDDNIDFWSRSAFDVFGHTAATTAEWYQIAYPDPDYRREVIDRWKPALEQARRSAHAVNAGAYRVTCRDGSARLCELYAAFLADRLVVTFNDITERKKAEQVLRESEIKFRTLVENLPQEFFVKDRDFRYLMVNESLARYLGLLPEEVVGKVDDDLFPKELADKYRADDQRLMQTGQTEEFEEKSRLAGRDVWVHTVKTPLRNARGEIIGIFGLLLDITERKRSEEALRDALREKESLLREVHHRVKNNLQVISSLVRLQAGQIENPSTRAALQDMQNRIRSMALLHETLYRSGNLAQVDLAPYLQALCTQLFRSLVARPGSIQLRLNVASVYLDANQAVPCGLLVNELVSNCLKHAFPDGRAGEVLVEVQPVDGGPTVRLRVADNGVGLPADFDLQRLHSLGLHLVSDLAGQLQGQLQICRGGIASCQPAVGRGPDGVVGDALNESQPATEQPVTIAPATGAVVEVTFTPPPVHCPR